MASCEPEEPPGRFLIPGAFGLAPVSLQGTVSPISSFSFVHPHVLWQIIYFPQRGNHDQGVQRRLKCLDTSSSLSKMTCSRSQGLVDFFRPKIVSLLSLKTMCEIPLLFGDGSNKKKTHMYKIYFTNI